MENTPEMNSAVEYLDRTPRFAKKNSLDTIREYLRRLGDPQRGMKIIHVAGTNGKGSVCNFLSSCLRSAGHSVGLFISPHLITIRERMSVDGELISEEEFLSAFQKVMEVYEADKDAAGEEGLPHPLYFEFLFLIGMLWFKDKRPDYLILETGLGGRLDATNSLPDKAMTVITRIGLDHTAILGGTLGEIAREKAGILRKGCPAVFLDEPEEACRAIQKAAEEAGAPFSIVSGDQWEVLGLTENGIDFSLCSGYYRNLRMRIPTAAPYQCENAALTAEAFRILLTGSDPEMPDPAVVTALREGIAKSFWPGRMEEILPDVFIDGAHNPDGMRAFLESVKMIAAGDDTAPAPAKRILLFSCVRDKNYREELGMIGDSGLFTDIAAVPMQGQRALGAEELKACIAEYANKNADRVRIHETGSVRDAVERFILQRESGTQVFAAGSLYLIGEIRSLIQEAVLTADGDPG